MVAVNHTVVVGETRLKSGDVIRLSLAGPELMFSIVTDRNFLPSSKAAVAEEVPVARHVGRFSLRYAVAAITTIALLLLVFLALLRKDHNSVLSLKPIPEQAVDEGQRWELDVSEYVTPSIPEAYDFRLVGTVPAGVQLNETTGQLHWTPTESQGPGSYQVQMEVRAKKSSAAETGSCTILVREVNSLPHLQAIPDVTFALGTQEALEVQVVAVDDDLPRQPIEFRLGANAPTGMFVDHITGLVRWVPKLEHAGQTYPVEILAHDPETGQSPQRLSFRVTVLEPEAETPAESEVTAAVYLLVIEEPTSGTLFPFAVAFAVRENLLLTSGAVVQELAKARDKGMTPLAMHCVSQSQEEITSLYVKPDYVRLQDRPGEQIYNDLGAVQLSDGKRSVAPCAAAATPLEQGTPLRCVMPLFEAEPLTRFDSVTPTYHSAKIYMVTRRGDTTASPDLSARLLSLVGALPKNAYGSPIVNEQGQVVAVYVEKADLSKEESLASLVDRYHYALSLESLAGLLDDNMSTWHLVPKAASADSAREKQ